MPVVNFRKRFCFFSFAFRQNIYVRTFPRNQIFFERYPQIFFQNLHFGPILDRFLDGFSKFWFFIGEICILIINFWVIFENYSMHMLSIRGNDFIACWAYVEPISSHAEHTKNKFPRMLRASYKMWTFLHVQSMLSIRGTNFIAHWAYGELISSHAEHTGNQFHRMLSMRGNV
jgi:hypothetical protein